MKQALLGLSKLDPALTIYEYVGIQGISSRKPSLTSLSLLCTPIALAALVAQPWKGVQGGEGASP